MTFALFAPSTPNHSLQSGQRTFTLRSCSLQQPLMQSSVDSSERMLAESGVTHCGHFGWERCVKVRRQSRQKVCGQVDRLTGW